jgi:hypothetical protein
VDTERVTVDARQVMTEADRLQVDDGSGSTLAE